MAGCLLPTCSKSKPRKNLFKLPSYWYRSQNYNHRRRRVKMQGARNAKETTKESAGNMAASAKAGVEKTKASAQEKVDRMTGHDPVQKGMAAEKKQERKHTAEVDKQETRENNAAAKQMNEGAGRRGHTNIGGAGAGGAY